ncbi:hypothetical protein D3C71_21760 [compost metagenome]
MEFTWMHLPGGLHLNIDGRPRTVAKDSEHYAAVSQAIKDKLGGEEVLAILDAKKRIIEEAVVLTPNLEFNGGSLRYQGEPVAGVIGERMFASLQEGFDLTPSIMFLENLMQNPSKTVVDNLYDFLEHGKCTFTPDGHFLAYKAVRENWFDIHSGKFDNSIGKVLEMPRNRVDEDRNNTCSYGFHVCSFDYLRHFAHANGHVVVCKVNPRDVVAIPSDYNNTKMRVCRYEVLEEVTDYYERGEDKLAAAAVAADLPFRVEVDYGDGDYAIIESFDRLSEASSKAEEMAEEASIDAVRIINSETGAVIFERTDIDRGFDDRRRGDDDDDDDTFHVVGIDASGEAHDLDDGYDTVSDALAYAMDIEGYVRVEVRDQNDVVRKTIS